MRINEALQSKSRRVKTLSRGIIPTDSCRCQDCRFMATDYMTSYDGRGMIEFSYCAKNCCIGKMVDVEVMRECESFGLRSTEVNDAS